MLNWEKFHFMVQEGIVLGHRISARGIEVDRAKIEAIEKLPPPVDHYLIHGPARLAFKWKKIWIDFQVLKIHPRGGQFFFGVATYFLLLFYKGENQVRTKNPNDSSMEKSGMRKLDFWVRGSDYLSGRYLI